MSNSKLEVLLTNTSSSPCVLIDDFINGQHRLFKQMQLNLPTGGNVRFEAPAFDVVCGVHISQFGAPDPG